MADKSILAQYDEPKNPVKKGATQLESDVHKLAVYSHIMLWTVVGMAFLTLITTILMIISAANLGAIAGNTDKKSSSSSSYDL